MSAFAIDIEANRPGDSARSFDGVEHERKAEKETAPSELDRDDDGPRHSLEYGSDLKDDPRAHAETWENKWGVLGKTIAFLIRHGCEARGISPVPVEVSCQSCPSCTPVRVLTRVVGAARAFEMEPASSGNTLGWLQHQPARHLGRHHRP